MILANLFFMNTAGIMFFYPLFLIFFARTIFQTSTTKETKFTYDNWIIKIALIYLFILNLARTGYVLEWLMPGVVMLLGDDYWRLGQIMSTTLSEEFPLKFYLNQNYQLSYYYCSLFPITFIKQLIPIFTLKDMLFLGNLFYSYFIIFSLFEVSRLLFNSKKQIYTMIFMCTLFYGFAWAAWELDRVIKGTYDLQYMMFMYTWWQDMFHGNTQITPYSVALFHTITNFVGFYSIIVTFCVFRFFDFKKPKIKVLIVLGLLINSFYSSVFSFMPLILFFIIEKDKLYKFIKENFKEACIFLVLALVPLYVFFGKLGTETLTYSTFRVAFTNNFVFDKILSFPIYVVLVPLVDLAGIPLWLMFKYKKFDHREKKYYIASVFYFILTYFIAYGDPIAPENSVSNNLSMRGMFIPTFIFSYLFCKYYSEALINKCKIWSEKLVQFRKCILFLKILVAFFGVGLIIVSIIPSLTGLELSKSGMIKMQFVFALIGFFSIVSVFQVHRCPKGSTLIISLVLATSIGTFKEIGCQLEVMAHHIYHSSVVKENSLESKIRHLARNNDLKYFPLTEIHTDNIYLQRTGEKFMKGIEIESMHNADSQTLKYPRQNWFR